MSAGNFVLTTYTSNAGVAYPIRVQPETLQLSIDGEANTPGLGLPLPGVQQVRVSAGKRQSGLAPRKIGIRFTGDVPTGYESGGTHYVVVLQENKFNGYTLIKGLTGTYLGKPIEVIGASPEYPL